MRSLLLTCLLVTAAPLAAQTPDIRGLTFNIELGLQIDGVLQAPGVPVHLQDDAIQMGSDPHTFDVLPDPAAPGDPARILIRTRLPAAGEAEDPMRFVLVGTYDAVTGAIEASGTLPGCHTWLTPFTNDDFGQIDAPAQIAIMIRQPELTLHVVVAPSVADSQILVTTLAGGLALGPRSSAGELQGEVSLIAWLPSGENDLATAMEIELLADATLELSSLQAHSADVFGDLTGDLLLTPADLVALHAHFGPVTPASQKADVTADGVVDQADADYEQFLLRTLGWPEGPGASPGVKGSAGKSAEKTTGLLQGTKLGLPGTLP
jgi:hypothetical protein